MNDIQAISSKVKIAPDRPPFILDNDLATIYGTTAKNINRAVKRNPDRFPDDFFFQLTKAEAESLGIVELQPSRGKHLKYLPYGFTREGCNMCSSVLNTPTAIKQSISIMRAFSAMERGERASFSILKDLAEEVSSMRADLIDLKSRPPLNINLPDDTALPVYLGRKTPRRRGYKAARDSHLGKFLMDILMGGATYEQAVQAVKEKWPDDPRKHISNSSIARFWKAAREGLLKEYGIDPRMN